MTETTDWKIFHTIPMVGFEQFYSSICERARYSCARCYRFLPTFNDKVETSDALRYIVKSAQALSVRYQCR